MVTRVEDARFEQGEWVSGLRKVLAKVKPDVKLEPKKTALFIVDVQKGFCLPDFAPSLQTLKEIAPEDYSYFQERMKVLVPNLQRLQDFFRRNNLEVVQCVTHSRTEDGRDTDRSLGIHFPPGAPEAEVIDELKPRPNELLFTKTPSGMFGEHNTYYVLRRMGIEYLVFGGMLTDACVLATVKAAVDLFGADRIVVVEDCCAAFNEGDHISGIRVMGNTAAIGSTDTVIRHISEQLELG